MSHRGSGYGPTGCDELDEQLFRDQVEHLGRGRAERARHIQLTGRRVRSFDGADPLHRSVTNTTADFATSGLRPEVVIAELLTGSPLRQQEILDQEARGQAELVASTVLPSRIYDHGKAALEAAGVVFGKPVQGDVLFVEATLPAGWRKVGTNHDMWSDLLDDRDRVRAAIFYKASWHDRSAHMSVRCRYDVASEYEKSDAEWHKRGQRAVVKDMGYGGEGRVLLATSWQFPTSLGGDRWESPRPEKEAQAWLKKHFPRCKDASAYWNETGPKSRNQAKKHAVVAARRIVQRESADVRSDDLYAQSCFQRRVATAARGQLKWIAPQWHGVYLMAFMATAERDRLRDAEAAKAPT